MNPTQNSPRRRGPRLSSSRIFPAVFPRAPHLHRFGQQQDDKHSRQNARQCRRVALSSHRCRPSLLSRCAIHEAFRLRSLGRRHSCLSVCLVLLGYVIQNSCAVGYKYKLTGKRRYSEMADPTKSRLRPALRLGGVFGLIGGFLLAYQRSSCEFVYSTSLTHGDHAHAN